MDDDTMSTQASVAIRFAIRSGALRAFDFVASSGSAADAAVALNAAGGGSRPFHALPAMSSPDAGAAAALPAVVRVVAVAPTSADSMQLLITSLNAAVRALGGAVKQRPASSWSPCPAPEAATALHQQVEESITAALPPPVWRTVRVLPPDTSAAGASGGAMKRMPAVSINSIRVDVAADSCPSLTLDLSISVAMLRHRQLRIPDDALSHLLTTGVSVLFKEPRECVLLPSASPALLIALHPGWADDVACDDDYSQPGDTADAENIVAEVRLDAGGGGNMLVPLPFVSGPGGGASPAGIHVATSVALSLATLVHDSSLFGEPGRVHAPSAGDVTLPELQRRRCDAAKEFADEDAGGAWTWQEEAPFEPAGRGQAPQGSMFVSAHLAPIGTSFGEADRRDASDASAHSLEPEPEAAAQPPPQTQRLQRPFITVDFPVEAIEAEAPPAAPRRPPPAASVPVAAQAQQPLARKPIFASFKPVGNSAAILPRTVPNADKKGGAAGKPAVKPAVKPRAEQPATGDAAEPAAKKPRPAKEELDPVAVDADVRQRAAGGVAALTKLTLPQCKAFLKHNKAPGGLGGNKQALLDRIAAFLGLQAPAPVGAVAADQPVT